MPSSEFMAPFSGETDNAGCVFLVLAGLPLAACNPELNWREVRADSHSLTVLLPCKPDRGARVVSLAGRHPDEHAGLRGGWRHLCRGLCRLADAGQAGPECSGTGVQATLANMRAARRCSSPLPWPLCRGGAVRRPGQRPDGKAIAKPGGCTFRKAQRMYQAVIYADG
jgi:hypothetical protein